MVNNRTKQDRACGAQPKRRTGGGGREKVGSEPRGASSNRGRERIIY